MKTVTVSASKKYNVLIENGVLNKTGDLIKDIFSPCKACIVTDDTVNALYSDCVEKSLKESGFDTVKFVIAHGEASKSTQNLISLVEFLAENRLTRSDIIIALGGGVVGDLAGFAASVYLRGINFIQIPTTLLSAVDSSVGGKTAVNLSAGKNLIGAFHQPSLVICDPDTLKTLPDDIFSDGCAEVIKYAVISNPQLFDLLKHGIRKNLEEIIAICVNQKAEIVRQDEFDTGCRQLLNLGHTAGHAIEACSNFGISHGSAVSMGMVIATKIATSMGLVKNTELTELVDILKSHALPTECPYGARELAKVASADKKRAGDHISFVIPHGIGNCKTVKVSVSELEAFISKGL